MGESIGSVNQPAYSRHPELQSIRAAQNQMLIDPSFMQAAMQRGQQQPQGGQGQQQESPFASSYRKQGGAGTAWQPWYMRGQQSQVPQPAMMQPQGSGGKF